MCSAEYEALERAVGRDERNFAGKISNPMLVNAEPLKSPEQRVSIKGLWANYVDMPMQAGFMRDGGKRQIAAIVNLRKFLKHDDAAKIKKKDVLAWRDHLMTTLAAKTVSDVYLSNFRTLFQWAADDDRILDNAASSAKQPKQCQVFSRERGHTGNPPEN